jgi:DNA-binding MarR family transcriptional regulator
MLDRLKHARLIERCPNPHDRRDALNMLTDERNEEVGALFAAARETI